VHQYPIYTKYVPQKKKEVNIIPKSRHRHLQGAESNSLVLEQEPPLVGVHPGVGVDRAGLPHHGASGRGGKRAALAESDRHRPGQPRARGSQLVRRTKRRRGGRGEREGTRRCEHGGGERAAGLDWCC
jgi:hypothetical protein